MPSRAVSTETVVLNGGNSSRLRQPSSKAMRASASKRPLALDCAPRPRSRSRSMATANSGKEGAPAGSEGAVTGGGLGAWGGDGLLRGRAQRARAQHEKKLNSPGGEVRP